MRAVSSILGWWSWVQGYSGSWQNTAYYQLLAFSTVVGTEYPSAAGGKPGGLHFIE